MGDLVRLTLPVPHVAVLTLNRPDKKNALSIALRDAVSDALERLAADVAVKCVVLTGAGGAFSAGFDLSEFGPAAKDPEFHRTLWASSDRYHLDLLQFPKPIIAAVNGPALGADLIRRCCATSGSPPTLRGSAIPRRHSATWSMARCMTWSEALRHASFP